MALVIFNGTQYDDAKLPYGIDPADCVPAAEWFEANRTPPRSAAAEQAAAEQAAAAKEAKGVRSK